MNKEKPYREKTEQTRQRLERITLEEVAPDKELPPRGDIHRQSSKKTKWKFNYPIIRLLLLFFILLPITMFSIYSYYEGDQFLGFKKTNEEKGGYEKVAIGKIEESTNNDSESENKKVEENPNDQVVETVVSPSVETDNKDTGTILIEGNPNSEPTQTDQAASTETPSEIETVSSDKTTVHTVTTGETLYRIAMKYYQSKSGIEIIKQANQIKGNDIHNGQELVIPFK